MSTAAISFPFLGNFTICPPNSFTLFGHTFYWYGVIIACGFLLAVTYCYSRCERDFGISQNDLTDVLVFGVPFGIIGARLYYVIFFGNYHTLSEIVKIWEGGLAIYGGIIAAAVTILIVCRVKKISALAVMDVVSFGFLIGQCVGRWGNFMNREAFGYETDIFCRMGLTLNGTTIYVHPTFLYESLWNLIGFLGMHICSKKFPRKFDGQYFLTYIAWYGLGRVWIEGLRTDSLYIGAGPLRVSQLLAGITFVSAAAALALLLRYGRFTPDRLYVNRAAGVEETGEDIPEADAVPNGETPAETGPDAVDSPGNEQEPGSGADTPDGAVSGSGGEDE